MNVVDTASMHAVTESDSCTAMLLLCKLSAVLQYNCTELQCFSYMVNWNKLGLKKHCSNLPKKGRSKGKSWVSG